MIPTVKEGRVLDEGISWGKTATTKNEPFCYEKIAQPSHAIDIIKMNLGGRGEG
jgi:hypothetical protein